MLTFAQIEEQISDLLSEADKLRPLEEDDPLKLPLALIVDKINALRADQSKLLKDAPVDVYESVDSLSASAVYMPYEAAKPKRGRPAKVEA